VIGLTAYNLASVILSAGRGKSGSGSVGSSSVWR
jgi:hypothetical protein